MTDGYEEYHSARIANSLVKIVYYAAKNRISPPESRGQRCTQVPPGAEHMSMQWSHEKN